MSTKKESAPAHSAAGSTDDNLLPYTSTSVIATCLCKSITVIVPSPPTYLNECQCSACYRYGALWAYYEPTSVSVTAELGSSSKPFIREDQDKMISFKHCTKCGCLTHWWLTEKGEKVRKEDGRDLKCGVNGRMMDRRVLEGVPRKGKGKGK